MRHSLYLKFILAYLVFGLLGFLVVATFSSRMTLRYLTEERYLVLVLYAEGEYLGELTEEEYLAALSAGKYAEPLSECLPKL